MPAKFPLPWILTALSVAFSLLALSLLDFFPSLDGPEHVYTATVLGELLKHPDSWWSEWFVLDLKPYPNWFCQVLLMALVQVFPGAVAEKLLVGGYVLALVAAWWQLLRWLGVRSAWPVCLILPFVFNHFLFLGFYNFVWSVPLFFLAVGMVWKILNGERRSPWGLGMLLLGLYFAHALGLAEWGLASLCFALFFWFKNGWGGGYFKSRLIPLAVAAFPAVALLAWYLFFGEKGVGGGRQPGQTLGSLVRLDFLVPIHGAMASVPLVMGVLVLVALVFTVFRGKFHGTALVWLGLAVLQAGVALLAPDGVGVGSIIPYRLSFFAWLSVMVAVAIQFDRGGPVPAVRLLPMAALLAAILMTGASLGEAFRSQPLLKQGVSFLDTRVPDRSLLSSYVDLQAGMGGWRHSIFQHLPARARMDEGGVVLLDSSQGVVQGFPVRFRQGLDPLPAMRAVSLYCRWLRQDGYEGMSGREVDVVFVLGVLPREVEAKNGVRPGPWEEDGPFRLLVYSQTR